MANAKKKKSGGGGASKRSGSGGGGSRPKKKKGPDPIKSMALGAAIVAVIALFFMMPIAGDTPFNHLRKLIGGDKPAPEQTQERPAKSEAPPTRQPARTVKLSKAPPMEKVTVAEQKGLDDLIDARRTRK